MIFKSVLEYKKEELRQFHSGNKDLDVFLKCFASRNDQNGYGKTIILESNKEIIGYFTLCTAQVEFSELPTTAKIPRYPVPSIRIARLAVSKNYQNKGYGKLLIKEAFVRILQAAKTIGISIVIVDPKQTSVSFYEKFGFIKLNNKSTYFLTIQNIIEAVGSNLKKSKRKEYVSLMKEASKDKEFINRNAECQNDFDTLDSDINKN